MKRSLCLSFLLVACGGRPEAWDRDFVARQAVGLNQAVAVVDASLDRVLLLSSPGALELRTDLLPIGKNATTVRASPDGSRLFVLSKGVERRRNPDDERPSLTLIETNGGPRVIRKYEFEDSVSGLVLDPEREWAVLYATAEDGRVVRNPNEIKLIDLVHPELAPINLTVQSPLGSSPQRFTFTSRLQVPNGEPRRLLVVETEREVTLLDLSDAATSGARQVTQPLPENQSGSISPPVQVVFHDRQTFTDQNGDEQVLDPEIAVRFKDDSSVLLLPLAAPTPGSDRPFRLEPNIVDVGGKAANIEFVRTDDGIRLIALVSGRAALVDPRTSNVTPVELPGAFSNISRVTDELGSGETDLVTDIALLWSERGTKIALWNLGAATATASRGLSMLEVGTGISQVLDVPGEAFRAHKVLKSVGGDFFVLDLEAKRSSPMSTNGLNFAINLSPDGKRVWAYEADGTRFSSLDLDTLSAVPLGVDRPISGVFDIGRANSEGRTAIVLHQRSQEFGATLFNALDPDSAETRFYSGLVYQGLTHE
jgi:hypothetical protein